MKKFTLFLLTMMVSVISAFAQVEEGNYYIQNVESGLYMCGANSWGTQASATVAGEEFTVALAEGGYTITGVTLSSGNKTLGYNLYVDTNASQNGNVWTIAPVEGEDGVYTIYGKGKKDNVADSFEGYVAQSATAGAVTGYVLEASAEVTEAAKWRFVTKESALAGIKSGDNITYLFGNPGFTRNHATSAWTIDEGCTNKNLGGGENANFCAESYHSIFNIHQTLEGVPNGTYSMTAQGFYRQDGEDAENLPVFYANGKEVVFPVKTGEENSMSNASASFTQGLYTIEPVEFEVTDGTITLGVKNEANTNLWCIWDNFQITAVEVEEAAEIVVTLIGENEYTLNGHSDVTVDKAISSIKVAGLNQVMDEVTYAIYDKQVALAEGKLSVSAIGFAEFESPISLYEGVQYNVVISAGEKTLFDGIVIGAMKQATPNAIATVEVIENNVKLSFEASDVAPSWNEPITLDGKNIDLEFDDDFSITNVLWLKNAELADGEHTLVFPVGSLVINGVDNDEKYTLTFTIGDAEEEMELEVALALGEEENTLNTKTAVSIDAADAIKVNVMNAPEAIGISYIINEMNQNEDEEGTFWTVGKEIAVGEANLNTIAYAQLDSTLYFAQGTKYQVSVTVYGGNPAEPTELGAPFVYEINGSYEIVPEIAVSLIADEDTEYALNTHSYVTVDQPVSAIKVAGLDQVMGEVKYAIYDKRNTLAEGTLSVSAIGYAEFPEAISLYEGIMYNVVITVDDTTTLYDNYVIGAMVEPLLANGDFAEGVVGDVNIATYAKDGTPNQMQEVPGWSFGVENGDAKASGVVAYGSATTLGGSAYTVPAAGPEGTNGNALAVVGVWTGTVKYVQDVELPAGKYTMTVPVYNTAGTTAFVKNLIGAKVDSVETYATATVYPVGKWIEETVVFELAEDGIVTLSLGYEGANVGSGASQHLFYDCVKIEAYDELAVAKAAAIAALPVANESLFTPNAEDVAEIKAAIEAATTAEEIEAASAAAAELAIPALFGEYTVLNVTAQNYLGTDTTAVVLAADETKVTFEKAEGGFYIKVGESYINMKGDNNWNMAATPEPTTVWNFNLNNGDYTIQGPKGLIGTDATEAGSACYGNKTVDKNGVWTIAEVYAPEIAVSLINGAEQYLLNTHSMVSVENASAIKVQGLHQIMDSLSYSIFTLADGVVAEGTLSVNTIGYAEFEKPVSFISGSIYTVTIKAGEEDLYTVQFNGATVQDAPEAPEITSITVNPNKQILAVSFKAEDAAPTYNVSFALETADGTAVNTTVSGEYGQNYGDMIYTFGAALEDGDYVLVLPAGSMTFSLNGDPFNGEVRVPFTVGEVAPKADLAMSNMSLTVAEGEELDEDGDFKVTFNYTVTVNDESLTDGSHYVQGAIYYTVYDAAGEVAAKNSRDFEIDATARNIYVSGLEAGKEYNMVIDMIEVMKAPMDFSSMDFLTPDYDAELPTLTFTVAGTPELACPVFSPVVPSDSINYYLYNVETHTFMKGGNDWGTRASAFIDDAKAVKLIAAGETYKIGDLDCDGGASSWVDGNGRQGDGKWVITELENNTFELTNTAAPANTKWGVILDCSDTRIYFKNEPVYGYTWALVSEADYEAYKAVLDKDAIAALHAAKAEEMAAWKQAQLDAANEIALAAQKALIDGTNVYEAEGYNAYVANYEAALAAFNAGGYTETVVNPNAATGWHSSTAYNFLLTPWTTGGQQANNFDKNLYINTWSTEGVSDGSNFLVPFFEYWTGDGDSLGENTLATTVSDLTPGAVYNVSVWARVRIKNGSADEAYGISFNAGGEPVDICAGEQVGATQFRIIKAVATGTADEEGNLNIAFEIAGDNNISWLSYKDVKYTEAAPELADYVGKVVYIKNAETGEYLYGANAQNTAMGSIEDTANGVVTSYALSEVEGGYTFRCVTPAIADYSLWGSNPCYLNGQPSNTGVTFNLGKDQDIANGSTWAIEYNAEKGAWAIKNVGNGGYLNGTVTSEALESVWVLEVNEEATGVNSIATASKANGKYIENGKVVIVKNGVKYNVAGSIVK